MTDSNIDGQLWLWLQQMEAGDENARERLLDHFCHQLQRHAQKMLMGFPHLRRWVESGDVFQNAMVRLLRALDEVQPQSPKHFVSLACLQIRRELIDLVRHYFGPEGRGANHATHVPGRDSEDAPPPLYEAGETTFDPVRLANWAEFHEQINSLPEEERQVFDVLWYQEMTQSDAADFLGMSERTLKRRWQSARLRLHELLKGELPD
ncbi:MAG: RNA polymerase sigma factor [Gemmataceae bacterium]